VTGSRTLQVRPFHSSASAVWLPKLPELPTAMHQAGPAHDTADSAAPLPGLGVCWIAHRRPSHRSASVATSVDPTAVQADADVHDTPANLATEPAARLPPEAAARGEERAPETARGGAWPPAVHAANGAAAMTPAAAHRKTAALTRTMAALPGRVPARTAARVAAQPAPATPTGA
jgi:hypothetical protein